MVGHIEETPVVRRQNILILFIEGHHLEGWNHIASADVLDFRCLQTAIPLLDRLAVVLTEEYKAKHDDHHVS